jgi:putative peptide zinc metalloprotease protein
MSKSLFSASWYRVAPLKLRLRTHAQIHRQRFRGEIWYVLQDHQTGRFHRLSPSANLMLSLMDGRRAMGDIWDLVGQRSGDDPPTQDETIQLLSQLHASDLVQGEMPPDLQEIGDRSERQSRRELMNRLRNPLALRVPLFDPDRFLDATVALVRPVFTVFGFLAWLALVGTGIALALLHWGELTADANDRLFSLQNIAMLALVYPVVKALHESGHAYAAKVWGGAVHEVGVMMLILVPAPYVDATSSTAFRERWRRIVVSGAGIMVEFALAAVAMIFWVNSQPGFPRAIAFNVMLIGGVSTLLFNGNPLLRFDAYYILSDLLEIPNLGARANKYFWYLVERYGLGVETAESPSTQPGERKWLFWYAVLSYIYRTVLSLSIAMVIATQLFAVGVLLAAVSLFSTLVMPLFKGVRFIFTSPRLHGLRLRAALTSGAGVLAAVILLFLAPLPYGTVAEGVVWTPQRTEVRALAAGVVAEVIAVPDHTVQVGDPLIQLEDPDAGSRVEVLNAQKAGLQAQYDQVHFTDKVQAEVLSQQMEHIDATLTLMRTRLDELTVRADNTGRFVLPDAGDLVGHYLAEGDLVGYVVSPGAPTLRVVVPQSEVDLVRGRTDAVEVRYASDLAHEIPAQITREVPAAQVDLPSLALSTQGGGSVVLDTSAQKPRALEGLFVFDVTPNVAAGPTLLGARAFVRFDHGAEPVFWRVLRSLRQVFLSRFNV